MPNFNFVVFRAYFGHFSFVKSAKNKIAFLQRKECSNKKIEQNKSGLEFNFLLKPKCASLNFDFCFLTEPYLTSFPYECVLLSPCYSVAKLRFATFESLRVATWQMSSLMGLIMRLHTVGMFSGLQISSVM